jgi:capsid portal protein
MPPEIPAQTVPAETVRDAKRLDRAAARQVRMTRKRAKGTTESAPLALDTRQMEQISKVWKEAAQTVLPPPHDLSELARLMEKNATHAACVHAKASAISGVGWQVLPNENMMGLHAEIVRLIQIPEEERDPADQERLEQLTEKAGKIVDERQMLHEFFCHPNLEDTIEEINTKSDLDKQALGQCYWEVLRNQRWEPRELYHIPAISMRLLASGDGFAQIRPSGRTFHGAITPESAAGQEFHIVFFKKYGDPRIMSWRTGRFHGIQVPTKELAGFQERNPGYMDVKMPAGFNPAPEGFTILWLVKNPGEPTPVPDTLPIEEFATEVMWERRYSVLHGDGYGVPDIIPALAACAGTTGAHRYQLDVFENQAVPACLVTLIGFPEGNPEDGDDPVDRMTDFFDVELRGQSGRTLVMGAPGKTTNQRDGMIEEAAEVKVEKLSEGVDEGAFLGYLDHTADEILRAERVPGEMIAQFGGKEGGNTQSSGISIALEVFKSFVIRPEQRVREARFNRLIQEGWGFDWRFEFLQIDTLDELREMEIAKGYYGVHSLTINEIRQRLGKDPIPGGDRPFVITPIGIVFLDEMGKLTTQDTTQRPDNPLDPGGQGSPNGRGNTTTPEGSSPEKEPAAKNSVQNLNAYGMTPRLAAFLTAQLWVGPGRAFGKGGTVANSMPKAAVPAATQDRGIKRGGGEKLVDGIGPGKGLITPNNIQTIVPQAATSKLK